VRPEFELKRKPRACPVTIIISQYSINQRKIVFTAEHILFRILHLQRVVMRHMIRGKRHEKIVYIPPDMLESIPAVTQTIESGALRLDILIDVLPPGQRQGVLYRTLKLHMLLTGKEFVFHCGWAAFSELLGLLVDAFCARLDPILPWDHAAVDATMDKGLLLAYSCL